MKVNWFLVFYNSFKKGWIDHFWGGKASWWWSIERVIPHPFKKSPANTRFMWALLSSYYEPKGIHFVSPTGSCFTCKERFDAYDVRLAKDGFYLLNGFVRKFKKEDYEAEEVEE